MSFDTPEYLEQMRIFHAHHPNVRRVCAEKYQAVEDATGMVMYTDGLSSMNVDHAQIFLFTMNVSVITPERFCELMKDHVTLVELDTTTNDFCNLLYLPWVGRVMSQYHDAHTMFLTLLQRHARTIAQLAVENGAPVSREKIYVPTPMPPLLMPILTQVFGETM